MYDSSLYYTCYASCHLPITTNISLLLSNKLIWLGCVTIYVLFVSIFLKSIHNATVLFSVLCLCANCHPIWILGFPSFLILSKYSTNEYAKLVLDFTLLLKQKYNSLLRFMAAIEVNQTPFPRPTCTIHILHHDMPCVLCVFIFFLTLMAPKF